MPDGLPLTSLALDHALLDWGLFSAAKANVGKPLILLTGHSHIRAYAVLDPWAVTMESGKYLDTVGLLGCSSSAAGLACDHEFVTPHRPTFYNLTATSAATFQTPASRAMRTDVRKLRRELGLDQVIGCSAREYRVWAPVDAPDSLWRLFVQQIAPAELPLPAQKHLVFVGSTGSFRWNLYQGPVSLDDTYVVNPFKDPFVAARTVPGPPVRGGSILPILPVLVAAVTDAARRRRSCSRRSFSRSCSCNLRRSLRRRCFSSAIASSPPVATLSEDEVVAFASARLRAAFFSARSSFFDFGRSALSPVPATSTFVMVACFVFNGCLCRGAQRSDARTRRLAAERPMRRAHL